jgi:hypothetical protein
MRVKVICAVMERNGCIYHKGDYLREQCVIQVSDVVTNTMETTRTGTKKRGTKRR